MRIGLGITTSQAGGAWSPAKLGSALLGFWDAERSDLITQAGGTVSSWRDAVGGYDLSQATGSLQPAYNASGFNSRPVVTFDGVDDFLNLEGVPFPTGAATGEIWVLADQTALAADTGDRTAFNYGGTSPVNRVANYRRVVSAANRPAGAAGNGASGVFVTNTISDYSGRHVVRVLTDGASVRVDADGNAGAGSALTPALGTTRTRMGATTTTTSGNFWQGGIAAVLVTSLLSGSQAATLLAYLKQRGGIA